jgi:Transposase DDE domain
MTKELEALLTELYVLIDDHVVLPRHGRGRRPELSDSELLCLAVAQMLLGFHSERRWVRHAQGNADLRKMFPYMPQQPGYHKRLKASRGLLCNTIRVLARVCPSWSDDLWITDATPVPCGTSRETVKRSDLAGHAGYGYCASYSRYYWGLKLYLVCAGDGMPIMWCLAHPKIGEREVVTALLDHEQHLIRYGQVMLADKGFSGKDFAATTAAHGHRAPAPRPQRRDLPQRQPRRCPAMDRVAQPDPQRTA